jgi:uncharacterized coiled-coil DUF342 family protein
VAELMDQYGRESFAKNYDEKLKEQLTFFDYIYPSISRQLDEVRQACDRNHQHLLGLEEERKTQRELIDQYKKKIQRIEQFLIELGLIELLGKNNGL